VKPDICGFSAWHFFYISLLVPRIEEAPKLSEICAPLAEGITEIQRGEIISFKT
jgi:hypothetical protein